MTPSSHTTKRVRAGCTSPAMDQQIRIASAHYKCVYEISRTPRYLDVRPTSTLHVLSWYGHSHRRARDPAIPSRCGSTMATKGLARQQHMQQVDTNVCHARNQENRAWGGAAPLNSMRQPLRSIAFVLLLLLLLLLLLSLKLLLLLSLKLLLITFAVWSNKEEQPDFREDA